MNLFILKDCWWKNLNDDNRYTTAELVASVSPALLPVSLGGTSDKSGLFGQHERETLLTSEICLFLAILNPIPRKALFVLQY